MIFGSRLRQEPEQMDCPFGIGRIGRGPDGLAAHVCKVRPARRLVGTFQRQT
jgi:hypothetical protein